MKVQRDALYVFVCHLEWRNSRNCKAYNELVAALDDQDPDIRRLAESLLHRSSPRPQSKKQQLVPQAVAAQSGSRDETAAVLEQIWRKHLNPHEKQSGR